MFERGELAGQESGARRRGGATMEAAPNEATNADVAVCLGQAFRPGCAASPLLCCVFRLWGCFFVSRVFVLSVGLRKFVLICLFVRA